MTDPNLILWPVLGHIALMVALYNWLSLVRFQARAGKDVAALESRLSRNIANQFEWPMMFYAIIALLFATGSVSDMQIILAWVFLAGRIIHTLIHVLTPRIILRGLVFTINYVAVLFMWGLCLYPRLMPGGVA